MQEETTAQVTCCRRDPSGQIEAVGGNGWLVESGIAAADIIARSPGPGPYYVANPTGDEHWLTVRKADDGQHFTLSTIAGDVPLLSLGSTAA